MSEMDENKYLTKDGLKKLQDELQELTTTKRQELSEKLQHAVGQGDLSENAEYQEAKEEQAFLEGRIQEIESILSRAIIIESGKKGSTVKIGSTVSIERVGAKRKETFAVVGTEEADPFDGRISYQSPLGVALMGHRAGEIVIVNTPEGPVKWKISKLK